MQCYHPLGAFQPVGGGKLLFGDHCPVGGRKLFVPCGQCIGCRLEYSRQWAVRCMHEARLHEFNCMLTLTYSDEFCPGDLSLEHRHVQLFLKRLRKLLEPVRIRYFMCGEYGEENGRPHYHVLVFGFTPTDRVFYRNSGAGFPAYTSVSMDSVWRFGRVYVGDVSFESAAYVARYCLKKVGSDGAKREIIDVTSGEVFRREHEYCEMSTRPCGIGAGWFNKYRDNCFPRDYVVVRGIKCSVPKYYDSLLCRESPLYLAEIKAKRVAVADVKTRQLEAELPELRFGDVRRLKVHEVVKSASIKLLKRG